MAMQPALAPASERAHKKCASCKRDKWLDEFAASGYCKECNRTKVRVGATRARRTDRARFNEYHREYNKDWLKARPKTPRHRLLSDL